MAAEQHRTPDSTLELTNNGLEMPEMLKGYSGVFTLRTASITGEYTTTDAGLPDTDYYDGLIAAYPDDDGDYNEYLGRGLLSFETSEHTELVFRIVDKRADGGGADV